MPTPAEDSQRPPSGPRADGELVRRPAPWPLRALALVSGVALLTAAGRLGARYLLFFRRAATLTIEGSDLVLDERWSLLGREIRTARTVAPLRRLEALRLENRTAYLQLLAGASALAVGTLVGVQFLLDGLRAGYPQLALLGAGIVAAGAGLDAVSFLLFPAGPTRCRLRLSVGRWELTLAGVAPADAARVLAAARRGWQSAAASR